MDKKEFADNLIHVECEVSEIKCLIECLAVPCGDEVETVNLKYALQGAVRLIDAVCDEISDLSIDYHNIIKKDTDFFGNELRIDSLFKTDFRK